MLPTLRIQEIRLAPRVTHLLDELHRLREEPMPDALFVYDMELSLPVAANAAFEPIIANLNASRDLFREVIDCPLVLLLPEYAFNAMLRGAPDFFSVRSGLYSFASTPQETRSFAERLTAGNEYATSHLSGTEKWEMLGEIENLLADYRALPFQNRDRVTELRLRNRQAEMYEQLGFVSKALHIYQESLKSVREEGNRAGESDILLELGILCNSEKNWTEAEQYLRHSLAIRRELGNRLGEG